MGSFFHLPQGSRVLRVRIPVGAPDSGGVRATALAKVMRIIAERIVPILERIHRARRSEEVDGGLDVVVAV